MDYVTALQGKRAAVWAELEALREQQREIGERLNLNEMQLRNIDELLAVESRPKSNSATVEHARPAANFLDASAEILGKREEGTHYQELLELLRAEGVHVPGRDPGANLIAHMGRDSRFVRTGRGTYGIRDSHKAVPPTRKVVRRARRRGRTG